MRMVLVFSHVGIFPKSETVLCQLVLHNGGICGFVYGIEEMAHIHLGVLIPAFMLGCLVSVPGHQAATDEKHVFDMVVPGLFMFLVGMSLPKVSFWNFPLNETTSQKMEKRNIF